MRVISGSSAAEMVAIFLRGELTSERFGPGVRLALLVAGLGEQVVLHPDLTDQAENEARRRLLGVTRGYGQDRDLFDAGFPSTVPWNWVELTPAELATVRYIDYSYWNELSAGSRLPLDAATRIKNGDSVFGVPNDRFVEAASALEGGAQFPPMILAGPTPDRLVCLEGHLRLTAHALAAFPTPLTCMIGVCADLAAWAK